MYIFFSCLHFVPDTSSFSGLPQSAKTVVSTEPPLLQVPGLKLLMPLHRAHARFYALEKGRRKRKEGGEQVGEQNKCSSMEKDASASERHRKATRKTDNV